MTPRPYESAGFEKSNTSFETPKTIFENPELLEKCYIKAEAYLEECRIKLDKDTFPNYDPVLLADANEEVRRLEKKFSDRATEKEKLARKVSVIMEAILTSQTENDWFGSDAQMITPSRYDDIRNGVDGCIEFTDPDGAEYLALSIDFTFSHNGGLARKIQDVEESIRSGTLSKMDFFVSSQLVPSSKEESEMVPRFVGSKSGIPKVVVGCDAEHITEMAQLWAEGKNKTLSTHPARLILLDQMILQMGHYIKIAEDANHPQIAEIYKRDLAIVQDVRVQVVPEVILSETDQVTESIRELTRR
jgi:hypothetical protein